MASVSTTAISKLSYQIVALLYVDDTDLPLLNKEYETIAEIVDRAQSILSIWYKGLQITGGDLKINKCSWTL